MNSYYYIICHLILASNIKQTQISNQFTQTHLPIQWQFNLTNCTAPTNLNMLFWKTGHAVNSVAAMKLTSKIELLERSRSKSFSRNNHPLVCTDWTLPINTSRTRVRISGAFVWRQTKMANWSKDLSRPFLWKVTKQSSICSIPTWSYWAYSTSWVRMVDPRRDSFTLCCCSGNRMSCGGKM